MGSDIALTEPAVVQLSWVVGARPGEHPSPAGTRGAYAPKERFDPLNGSLNSLRAFSTDEQVSTAQTVAGRPAAHRRS